MWRRSFWAGICVTPVSVALCGEYPEPSQKPSTKLRTRPMQKKKKCSKHAPRRIRREAVSNISSQGLFEVCDLRFKIRQRSRLTPAARLLQHLPQVPVLPTRRFEVED